MINRQKIYGLIFDCPERLNNKNCPFVHIRKMESSSKIEILEELTSEEIRQLVKEHEKRQKNGVCQSYEN